MSLPFAWPAAACLAGMLAASKMSCAPQILLLLSGFPLLLLWRLRGRFLFMPVFAAALALLSFSWGRFAREPVTGDVSLWASHNPLNLAGVVMEEPEVYDHGQRRSLKLVVRASEVAFLSEAGIRRFRAHGMLRVSVTGPAAGENVHPGDRVQLHGVVSLPRAAAHPDLFDEREWLARRGIRSVMRVYESAGLHVFQGGKRGPFSGFFDPLRSFLKERLSRLWQGPDRAWIAALLIGERSGLDPRDKDALFRTGTIHILSISGLHVALLSGAVAAVFMAAGYPPRASSVLAVTFSFVYAGVSGGAVPVVRASLMTALVLGGKIFGRPVHLLNILLAVMTCVLILDPRSVDDLGARLSFLCVFCLLLPAFFPSRDSGTGSGGLSFRQSAAVMAGVLPLIAREFHVITPSVFLANFLAVPLFHAVLVHAFLALVLPNFMEPAARGFAMLASGEMSLAMRLLHFISGLPGSCVYVRTPSSAQLAAYYGLLFSFLAVYRGPQLRKIATGLAAAWTLALLSFFYVPARGIFEITLLPLRSGIAAHVSVQGRRHWIVSDDLRYDKKNAEAYLRGAGVRGLEGLLLTRGKKLPELSMPVRRYFCPAGTKVKGEGSTLCTEWLRGMRLVMGGRTLEVFSYRGKSAALGFCEARQCVVWISEVSDAALQDVREELAGRHVPVLVLERPLQSVQGIEQVNAQLRPERVVGKMESPRSFSFRTFLNLGRTGGLTLSLEKGQWGIRDFHGESLEPPVFKGMGSLRAEQNPSLTGRG